MARQRRLRGRSSTQRVGSNSASRGISFSGSRGSLRGSPAGVIRRRAQTFAKKFVSARKPTVLRKMVQTPVGGATSNSYCVIKHKAKRLSATALIKRIGAPNTYIYQRANQFVANQGFQNAYPYAWNQAGDLITMLSGVPSNQVNPPATNLRTNRYVLQSMTGELLLTNSSLASAYVEIYDLVVKRDPPQFSTSYQTTQYELANPLSCWTQGVADLTNTTANLDVWSTIKSLPYDSGLFNQYFKVVKRHHVNMTQGATHRHTVNLDVNKMMDGELLQAIVGANGTLPNGQNLYRNLKGVTMYSLIVAYGQPASIPQESGGPIVTTSRIAIDCVQSLRYKYQWVQDTTRSGFFVDNLSTLGGEQVVSIGAGTIVANNIA